MKRTEYLSIKKIIIKVYLILLHLSVIIMLLNPYSILKIDKRLGIIQEQSEVSQEYKRMLIHHSRVDGCVPSGATIFIGDSITQGLCVAAIISNGINFGIGGDTTTGVLNRIKLYKSIKRAGSVVLAIGINDLSNGRTNIDILNNYRKILSEIPKDILIIISAVLPVGESILHIRLNKRIIALNNGIKDICTTVSNCYFFNSGPNLVNNEGNLDKKYHVGDGIHLSEAGYHIWINDLKAIINKVATPN